MSATSQTSPRRTEGLCRCLLAGTPELREQVYRLRYHCYLRNGSIPASADQRFRDAFDDQPNSFSFLAQSDREELEATVRITVVRPDLGWTDAPACHVYGDHPAFQKIAQCSFVEASRLSFRRQARRDAFVNLVGNMAALADYYDVAALVACPREEHAHIYQRLFGFAPVALPRQYFGVNFRTTLLVTGLDDLRSHARRYRPMKRSWEEALERFQSSDAVPLWAAAGRAGKPASAAAMLQALR